MDRVQVFPGAIPLETDLLNTNKNTMVGLAKLAAAMLGTSTQVNGLSVVPTGPASLQVFVNPGEIYQLVNLDGTAYSSLAADTTHQIVKQGILLDQMTLSCPSPATAGFSVNYLIEATYSDIDALPVVLPYYNASNPAVAYSGPANVGTTNNTVRQGKVTLTAKAGTAATTGTQTTPAADAGYVGLYVVTVANGQTQITAPNIAQVAGAPIITPAVNGRLLNVQVFTASGTYTPTPGTTTVIVEVQAGGGAGGGTQATGASQVAAGSGGGAGGYAKKRITSGFAGAAVTVGVGGAVATGANGGNGNSSSFGAILSATGGIGGSLGPAAVGDNRTVGGATGGTGTGGSINISGGFGRPGVYSTQALGGEGGGTPFGSGPIMPGANSNGPNATNYGAGGSGAATFASQVAYTGGAGAAGIVIISEYA